MPPKPSIEEAAARWIGLRSGGLTPVQERELAAWLRADPRHRDALARLEGASRALDRLAALRPRAGGPDPDVALPRPRPSAWRRVVLAAAAAAVVAGVGLAHHRAVRSYSASAETGIGGLRTMALADGSSIELNTDSVVQVQFRPAERRVRLLRGEAYFSVAKDPSRPFIVSVGGVAVRAVGTAFKIRLRNDAVEVLVTEGRVRVEDPKRGTSLLARSAAAAGFPVLTAGHRAMVPIAGGSGESAPSAAATVTSVSAAEMAQGLAWERRQLVFDPTPLESVVAEFNRYNRHKLVVADPAIRGLLVGGTFSVNDYETFARLLEASFGVAVERTENETILRARDGSGEPFAQKNSPAR